MKFTYFRFENFKGIENETIVLGKNSNSHVHTLVGLNESGKTTILEAINYFKYKKENLQVLELDNYEINDIHNLIPINKRDNFNGKILIEAQIELDDDDINEVKKGFQSNNIILTDLSKKITYTQKYHFENSVHVKGKDQYIWQYDFTGKIAGNRRASKLKNEHALLVSDLIRNRMPSILYFPNFLFEFPEKIYLDSGIDDPKHKFYQTIIQDVLDSLDNKTNIQDHLIQRIQSEDEKDKRNLNSLLGKMQKKLTEVIFNKWNQIFKKEISKIEIVLYSGKDSKGTYLEFNIKDDVDTYRIVERSLGFRWFFVYILLTQFRTYRKQYSSVFFLFDEPASNLHPSAQIELLKSFEGLPNVIYTTHSHYLINPQWLENTFVIKNEGIDYENESAFNTKNTNIKICRYREFAVRHPNQISYFQPILEVLDYRPSNLELVPEVIITEGKNDYYAYNYYLKIISNDKNPLKFVPGTGSTNMETLISLYLGWGVKFFVLLDSDNEGYAQKKRYIDLFGESLKELIITYADIDNNWSNMAVENIFSEDDKTSIHESLYPLENKFTKKIFNRCIQELYISNKQVKLSEETIINFSKIVTFFKHRFVNSTDKDQC